jgi:hypothetical protein
MEYWNGGILGRIWALFFVMFYSEIRNLHSGIEEGVMIWYGSCVTPEGDEER